MRRNFRSLIEENKWLKGVPTTLTICNSLCGFSAILYSLQVYVVDKDMTPRILTLSSFIILGAMIFDALDGFAARLFNAASMHGIQMDSLADMVTFGVAPAVMVAVMAHKLSDLSHNGYYFVWLMSSVYLGCAALRLATYNVHAMLEKKSSEKFSGLPSPGAAAAICSLIIFFNKFGTEYVLVVKLLPLYAGVLGFLMVSNISYTHVGKWIQSVKRNNKRATALLVLLALLYWNPVFIATIAINAYVLLGPIAAFFRVSGKAEKMQPALTSAKE